MPASMAPPGLMAISPRRHRTKHQEDRNCDDQRVQSAGDEALSPCFVPHQTIRTINHLWRIPGDREHSPKNIDAIVCRDVLQLRRPQAHTRVADECQLAAGRLLSGSSLMRILSRGGGQAYSCIVGLPICRYGPLPLPQRGCWLSFWGLWGSLISENMLHALDGSFGLTDGQWAQIEPHCLEKPMVPGRSGRNNRLFTEAVLWIVCTRGP